MESLRFAYQINSKTQVFEIEKKGTELIEDERRPSIGGDSEIVSGLPLLDNSFYTTQQSFAVFLKNSRAQEGKAYEIEPNGPLEESENQKELRRFEKAEQAESKGTEFSELALLLESSFTTEQHAESKPVSFFAAAEPVALVRAASSRRRLSDFVQEALKQPIESEQEHHPTPQPLVSATPQPLVSTTHQPLVSTAPQTLVFTAPQTLISTTHQPSVSTTPQPLVSTTHQPLNMTPQRLNPTDADPELFDIFDTGKDGNSSGIVSTSPLTKTFAEASVFDHTLLSASKMSPEKRELHDASFSALLDDITQPQKPAPPPPLIPPPNLSKVLIQEPFNSSTPQPFNASTPQPLNTSTPQTLNPSTTQPLNPQTMVTPRTSLSTGGRSAPNIRSMISAEREHFLSVADKEPLPAAPAHRPKPTPLLDCLRSGQSEAESALSGGGGKMGLTESSMGQWGVEPGSPSLKYLLTLKIFQCLTVSSQVTNLKTLKQRFSSSISSSIDTLSSIQSTSRAQTASSFFWPTDAFFSKVFGLKVTSVLTSPQGDEALMTFLFRGELVLVVRVQAKGFAVHSALAYITDGGNNDWIRSIDRNESVRSKSGDQNVPRKSTDRNESVRSKSIDNASTLNGSTPQHLNSSTPQPRLPRNSFPLRVQSQRSTLTDLLLLRFRQSCKPGKFPCLFDCLSRLCSDYDAYISLLCTLSRLRRSGVISNFSLEKNAEIRVRFSPLIFHYIEETFRLKLGEKKWTIEFEKANIDPKILLITRKMIEEIHFRIERLLSESLEYSVGETPKRLEKAIKASSGVSVTCFRDGDVGDGKDEKISEDPKDIENS